MDKETVQFSDTLLVFFKLLLFSVKSLYAFTL